MMPRILDADGRTVGEGEVIWPRRQADIIDNELAILFWNHLVDLVLDSLEDPFGAFDTGSGRKRGRAAGSGRRRSPGKKSRPTSIIIAPPSERIRAAADRDDEAMAHEYKPASTAYALRMRSKPRVKATSKIFPDAVALRIAHRLMMFALEQQADGDRRQRARQSV